MKFGFHPEALAEFRDAARRYRLSQEGVALRFVVSVEDAIERILEDDVRRCLTRVFPYAVLYTVESEFVLIIAVMRCHLEPGYWRERISG
jgi:toxin ParE1/3/4